MAEVALLNRTHLLYQLQGLDSKIDKAKQELAEVEAQLGESAALRQAKQTSEMAQQQMRQAQTKLKDLELEVKGLSDKIAGQEKLLYSGKAMSAKEAANLQDEIASLKRWHSAREELLLEAMLEAEEAEETVTQAQDALSRVEAEWRDSQGDLGTKQQRLQAEIEELQQQRPTFAEAVDQDDLREYDALRRKKGGVAIAAVKGSVCQSCGMIASNNKIRQAGSGADLVYCGGCGRILYIL